MKPITILSALVMAALGIGVAMAERLEVRAQYDRLSFDAEPPSSAAWQGRTDHITITSKPDES